MTLWTGGQNEWFYTDGIERSVPRMLARGQAARAQPIYPGTRRAPSQYTAAAGGQRSPRARVLC